MTRTYKRSQVEQVIGMLEFQRRNGQVSPALRSRLKRLLDADRAAAPDEQVREGKRLAFLDGPKPGHGAEVGYSPYQAFALLLGVRLLEGGITEGRTVALLQRLREPLEHAFGRIAAVSRRALQDDAEISAMEAEQRVRDGVIVGDPDKMSFLVELAGGADADLPAPDDAGATLAICDYAELYERLRYISHMGCAMVVVELTNAAHQLLYFLPHTTVRKRGRP